MGEALVALDRIADAVQMFSPELVTDVSTVYPEQKTDPGKGFWIVWSAYRGKPRCTRRIF